ncbi:GTPase [Massilia arenae]|uniref:GTPase n=1 Tax=Massilia arenae TaxID=2603288 RepID=A0A5C7FQZ8_9BURK|nr:GTPase [Massilia arenae]TXF97299.1 GTPase [Massilia arenae]
MMARAATVLVIGASAAAREQAIAALLAIPSSVTSADAGAAGVGTDTSQAFSAVILEGMGVAAAPLETGPGLQVVRIAPGCLCCDGNLVLRVTLNRLLRQRPGRLFLGLASSEHLDQLRSWLAAPPYDQLLALNPTVHA